MPLPTNQQLRDTREEHCFAITPERKYYRDGQTFIKRSLKPSEWQKHNGYMHIPLFNPERILNEGACIRYLAKHTNIPLPRVYACFEDDCAAYIITEYIEGVSISDLDDAQQKIVAKELETHLHTLKQLTSNTWGGPTGVVLPPWRVMQTSNGRPWRMRPRDTHDLVFCHNDLSASNVIVDPDTLAIKAIIDWEYAGFYPPEFEAEFFHRPGPSVALPGEVDDVETLLALMAKEKA